MAKKAPITLVEAGTVLASFEVPGRAVPWKAPTYSSHGTFKDKKLQSWQQWVWAYAIKAYRERAYEGPVKVCITAYIRQQRGAAPDASNIGKAIEDALQTAVIANDRQVESISTRRIFDESERVVITVEAA